MKIKFGFSMVNLGSAMHHFTSPIKKLAVVMILLLAPVALPQTKRPLTVKDFDGWRDIQSETLSDDGKFLAYGLFPEDGDGVVVIRNLQTDAEFREAAGSRPLRALRTPETDEPVPPPAVTIRFTADSRFVVFSAFPPKAEVEKAQKEKKTADEMPKKSMVMVDLASGAAVRVEQVKNFQVPDDAGDAVAYLREAEMPKAAEGKKPGTKGKSESQSESQGSETSGAKKEFGTELVLRNLQTRKERTFADVLAYTLSKDGATLVYAVAAKNEAADGLFAVNVAGDSGAQALLTRPGKYVQLSWDEPQKQLAFLSDRDDAKAKQPKLALYLWERGRMAAEEAVSVTSPGFREGFVISEKGAISFSHDGGRIFFGCAPPRAEHNSADDVPADEKVNADLWSWKDEHIQPMQRIRAEQERNRTYRAVYHVAEKKMVQLGDETMREVTPSEDGLWAIGADDRAYGPVMDYDATYSDYYLVDTRTGERRLILKKQLEDFGQGGAALRWAPDGEHILYFADKDWMTISVPDGAITSLTHGRGVNFWREDVDYPAAAPPYGAAGWTKDGKYVLLYDKFDIWRMTPDGSEAVNLTRGVGRSSHIEFRHVYFGGNAKDPEARWIDATKPLLLKATDTETFDSGFYRMRADGTPDATDAPQKLIFDAKAYTEPVKAKNADVAIVAASTFEEFPDLQVTDSNFASLKKVTDANPQQAQMLWGSAELIHYLNADGVPLEGILYKPANFDPQKKYPMIIYIYEKLSNNLHEYYAPQPRHTIIPSYYASNGYLILEPDIVYTIGEPGQSALKCVLPAIDSIVARGFVDEKAIGIEGHSWGGYQISYMITQTNRFRAAEAGAPVVDMFSSYDGIRWGSGMPRQFQYEHTQSRIGGTPWQAPLKYMENSPIFMADPVTTPLLILQNDADTAVPWYQGIEYYLALRRLGKEVYMFSYNGEPHGIVRRADAMDFTVRMQEYFDHFLKGAPEPDWMVHGISYLDKDAEKVQFKEKTGVY
ncbi:MAG: prolyl oligopeptidase family serine peptidase [Candidatus Acidiferrales bacterium]